MQLTTLAATAILTFAARVVGQQDCQCDGLRSPDWADCTEISSNIELNRRFPALEPPECGVVPAPAGTDPDSYNCIIEYCPRESRFQPLGHVIQGQFAITRNSCQRFQAAGVCTPTGPNPGTAPVGVSVQPNPNFLSSLRAGRLLASEFGGNFTARAPGHEQASVAVGRRQSQGVDTDQRFVLRNQATNVPRDRERFYVFGPSTAGSEYTVSQETSQSVGVSSSVTAGASAFEIFSAEVSIETSFEDTFSESVGYSVNVDCPVGEGWRGVIYWEPRYSFYEGISEPSGTQISWYVPNGVQESYLVECSQMQN